MRILVSNDDGIMAPGIVALAAALSDLGSVSVVAPDGQRSASSHAISLYGRLYVREVTFPVAGVRAFSVSGTPVDCVKWGAVMLGETEPFDFMASGINDGPNLATDVLYSGTVAAAGEAALQGIRASAFSLVDSSATLSDAADVAKRIVGFASHLPWEPDTFLNVNLPNRPQTCEWRATRLGARSYRNRFIERVDQQGQTYFRHAGEELQETAGDDADTLAIRNGFVSITPLMYRFTNDHILDVLKATHMRAKVSGQVIPNGQ